MDRSTSRLHITNHLTEEQVNIKTSHHLSVELSCSGQVNIKTSHHLSAEPSRSGTGQHQDIMCQLNHLAVEQVNIKTSRVSRTISQWNRSTSRHHVSVGPSHSETAISQWYLQHQGVILPVSQALSPWYLQHQGATLPVSQAVSQWDVCTGNYSPVLVHELLLGDGKGTQLVVQRLLILQSINQSVSQFIAQLHFDKLQFICL